jgi:ATP-binding cassette subfamily F protein 3
MVQLNDVSKNYGAQSLLEGVTWQVDRFRRTGLVGPNGSGKTTLLRLLAGELQPDGGEVARPRGVSVGYLPQEVPIVDGATVLSAVLEGRTDILSMSEELARLEAEIHATSPSDELRLSELAGRQGEVQERFEHEGGYRLVARAKEILAAMGFEPDAFQRSPASLSGGWRVRLLLSRLLLKAPDFLLLDEPTNHLDLPTLAWLESFLHDYPGCIVLVSHDRAFLNRTIEAVAALERGALRLHGGDYDSYVRLRADERTLLEKRVKEQAREIARVEEFAERFRFKATKAKQVQSRLRALDKMDKVEAPAPEARTVGFRFPPAARSSHMVVELKRIDKRYGDNVVYRGVDFTAHRGDRIALVGPNGSGKSTLLKIIAGVLPFDAGERVLGDRVAPGYFAQHQAEALSLERTVLDEMMSAADVETAPLVRGLLGAFLFSGDTVDKRVRVLSGGEKNRLALAKILLSPPNLLVMDEPTNHLDLDSREALEEALTSYDGCLVFISHDRYFINRLATKVFHVEGGRLREYWGSYDEYEAKRREEASSGGPGATATASASAGTGPGRDLASPASEPVNRKKDLRRQLAELVDRRSRATRALRDRIAKTEKEVADCEGRLSEIDRLLADPSSYGDAVLIERLGRERGALAPKLDPLLERWAADQAALEAKCAEFDAEEAALTGKPA